MAVAAPPPPLSPNDGVIREARRRQRLRRAQASGACLVMLSALAVAVWALLGGGGSAHGAESPTQTGLGGRVHAAGHYAIRLSPSLDGGSYGWCVAVEEPPGSAAGWGGCATTPIASTPLAYRISSGGAKSRKWSVVALVDPQVAALLVNGHERVRTLALPGLPYGLRAAQIVFPVRVGRTAHGRPTFVAPREPTLVALNAQGHRLGGALGSGSGASVQLAGHGPCALSAAGLSGLTPEWSHIASAIAPFPGAIVGRAFFSCIDTEYDLHGSPLDAAILLDAAHPGVAPAPIPGLVPVNAHAGYFNGPGDFKGELTAVRRGNAWLVVAGGRGLAQRIEVLGHLRAGVHGLR
jgi:hypothetical protein